MQKKLFFFHTFALVTAMAILLAVNSGVLHVVMGYYQKRAIPAADERSQQVQSVLDGWDENSRDWDTLEERLRAADYDLVVCQDGEIVSTSLDQGQQDFFSRLTENASWPADGTLVVQDSGVVLVGRQMGDYLLVAMPHFGQPDGPGGFAGRRPQAEVMLISVFVSGLAAIGVIWLFSVVFARYQLRQIMRPVNALTAGAKRVEQGDLSTPVAYQGRDEFTSVCAAFDQMQRHLLEEREKNAAYERARTDLVAGISHDLRTPLTSVKGYIKGMRDGVANTPEKQERYLDIAYRKSCDMERLLQRLLYFSRLETGNMPMFPVEDDLGTFAGALPGRRGGTGRFRRSGELPPGGGAPARADRPGAAAAGAEQPEGERPALCRGGAFDPGHFGKAGGRERLSPLCRQRPGRAGRSAAPPVPAVLAGGPGPAQPGGRGQRSGAVYREICGGGPRGHRDGGKRRRTGLYHLPAPAYRIRREGG